MLAGEKLKESKKKSKMASASSSSQRDWGKVGFEPVLACGVYLLQATFTDRNNACPLPLFREWPVLVEPKSAPSFPPITMALSQASLLALSGSSEFRLVRHVTSLFEKLFFF